MRNTNKTPLISLSRPSRRFTPDDVMGHHDDGDPITWKEVTMESGRMPPRGMPRDIDIVVPANCADDEWDRLLLVEQIKFRRKLEAVASAKPATASGASA